MAVNVANSHFRRQAVARRARARLQGSRVELVSLPDVAWGGATLRTQFTSELTEDHDG